jgi:hypothetical protein
MVDHKVVSQRNCRSMVELQENLLKKCNTEPAHIKPSDEGEVKKFFNIAEREN